MMKLEPSRFSSHCTLIAVLALVAGIAVTVESAAHQVGLRAIVAERAQNTIVMLRPVQELPVTKQGAYEQFDETGYSMGEI
jgi:hypothetical protein